MPLFECVCRGYREAAIVILKRRESLFGVVRVCNINRTGIGIVAGVPVCWKHVGGADLDGVAPRGVKRVNKSAAYAAPRIYVHMFHLIYRVAVNGENADRGGASVSVHF